jgi:hypothetical protein
MRVYCVDEYRCTFVVIQGHSFRSVMMMGFTIRLSVMQTPDSVGVLIVMVIVSTVQAQVVAA